MLRDRKGRHGTRRSQSKGPVRWTEPLLRQAVEALQKQVMEQSGAKSAGHRPGNGRCEQSVVDQIVALGMQPKILKALRNRRDPNEAICDLATRYAFEQLMVEGLSFRQLDLLSWVLIQRTLEMIYQQDRKEARVVGEHPLEEDERRLLYICESLSRFDLRIPIGAHITWQLKHYEGASSRAMRQIQHLVTRDEVSEAFVAFVLQASPPDEFVDHLHRMGLEVDEFRAQLCQMARGGGRRGVSYEAVIRFFDLPMTVEFVKPFADTVQTARTLYDEAEYEGIPWRGKRRIPADQRRGYIEPARASIERRYEASLDTEDFDLHDVVDASADCLGSEVSSSKSVETWGGRPVEEAIHVHNTFEGWATLVALEARPNDPLWQASALLFVRGLSADEIVAQGLADRETLAAALQQMGRLRANPDAQEAWMVATCN